MVEHARRAGGNVDYEEPSSDGRGQDNLEILIPFLPGNTAGRPTPAPICINEHHQ